MFVILYQDLLNLIPHTATKNTRMCAAALLNYFKNQKVRWHTITIAQLQEKLLGQYGKDCVAKATALLAEAGLVERQHHRLNPRAWQYKCVCDVKQLKKERDYQPSNFVTTVATATQPQPLVAQPQLAVDQIQEAVAEIQSNIYIKDPLEDPLKDHQQDPAPAAAEKFEIEEEGILTIKEIREIECTPRIQINQQVKEAIAKNPENVEKAVALVKQAVQTWEVGNKFNWTGLLVKALKLGLEPFTPAAATQKFEIPVVPSDLEQWCRENNARQYIWSDLEKAFKIQLFDGSWIDASSITGIAAAMGVQP